MRIDMLLEAKKKPKKKKIIYVENGDDQLPYPQLTISALEKEIKKTAKDLETDIQNPIKLVNDVMNDNAVPIPPAYLSRRWKQYLALLKVAVVALGEARGYRSSWSTT